MSQLHLFHAARHCAMPCTKSPHCTLHHTNRSTAYFGPKAEMLPLLHMRNQKIKTEVNFSRSFRYICIVEIVVVELNTVSGFFTGSPRIANKFELPCMKSTSDRKSKHFRDCLTAANLWRFTLCAVFRYHPVYTPSSITFHEYHYIRHTKYKQLMHA